MKRGMIPKDLINYYITEGIQIERVLEELGMRAGSYQMERFIALYDRLEADLDKCDCLTHLFNVIHKENTRKL